METKDVKSFMISSGFVSVVKTVRTNSNGYPYITFLTADNKAENVYFSKNAATMVASGDVIARGFFEPFRVAEVANADGEVRTKLVAQGDSLRANLEDLF